jgi:hypothetical protein
MKKTLLFVSALCLGTSAFAQLDSLPNANFDYWTNSPGQQEPNNWGTLNGKTFTANVPPFGNVTINVPENSVTRAKGVDSLGTGTIQVNTTAQSGQAIPGFAISNVAKNDITFSGTPARPTFLGGFPFRQRALALTGVCKYVPGGITDTAVIAVVLTKWIPVKGAVAAHRDTIGAGNIMLFGNTDIDTVWQNFAADITYRGGAVAPDTALIVLISSATVVRANSKIGSKLLVDSLDFDYGCSLDPNILASDTVLTPKFLPGLDDTLKFTAGGVYTKSWTFYIPRNNVTSAGTATLDSILVAEKQVKITGMGTTPSYTVTSNWPRGMFGTNTIACVSVTFNVPATPKDADGTITLTPGLFGYSSLLTGGSLQSFVSPKTDSIYGYPTPSVKPTPIKIGKGKITGIENFSVGGSFNVAQNIPNPFDGSTSINFNAVGNGNIDFTVTDVLGRQVYDTNINATLGSNTFVFTTDLANGTYFFSLSDGKNTVTKKMVVTK